jgi:succinyl-diaminopimelate desuccinylase
VTMSVGQAGKPGGEVDVDSIIALLADLVRTPSRGGLDSYDGVVGIVETWLKDAGLRTEVLPGPGGPLGIVCDVKGTQPGPHLVLDACLDTADVGDESAWTVDPFSAEIIDGWLYGRGSSDSKAAVAIFCHLAAQLASTPDSFHGTLTLLFDLDEHTGGFGGIRSYLDTPSAQDIAGVMIGYPGPDTIVIGGRGFLRAKITVFGQGDHSGSGRQKVSNAIARASQLVETLGTAAPTSIVPSFGLPPKLTVTSIRSGTPGVYSLVPDR